MKSSISIAVVLITTSALLPFVSSAAPRLGHRAPKVSAIPETLIAQRAQKVLAQLKSRPLRALEDSSRVAPIETSATKSGFLSAIYDRKLVEASWATEMLSDKRIFSEVMIRELGAEKAQVYYPKTVGLREFLVQHGFLNPAGDIKKDEAEAIEAALYQDFPSGFVARAAVGVAPQETTKGLFPDTDTFMVELLKPKTPLYQPSHSQSAVSAHLLGGEIASGEAVVLQENLMTEADSKKPLKRKFFQEVRVHTYEGRIVQDAVPARWVQKELLDSKQIEKAEAFVQEFLKQLPTSLVARQAWGIDVAVFDNGEMKINDIVTNRGTRSAWSSYLEQPRIIEAYVRHFESLAGVRFSGLSGWLLRNGFANYFPFWQKRIEKARGFDKVLAYLPPWP